MPAHLVRKEWEARVGHDGPLIIMPGIEPLAIETLGSRAAYIAALAEQLAAELAPSFKVSREAMRIRLAELGLLPRK